MCAAGQINDVEGAFVAGQVCVWGVKIKLSNASRSVQEQKKATDRDQWLVHFLAGLDRLELRTQGFWLVQLLLLPGLCLHHGLRLRWPLNQLRSACLN